MRPREEVLRALQEVNADKARLRGKRRAALAAASRLLVSAGRTMLSQVHIRGAGARMVEQFHQSKEAS